MERKYTALRQNNRTDTEWDYYENDKMDVSYSPVFHSKIELKFRDSLNYYRFIKNM